MVGIKNEYQISAKHGNSIGRKVPSHPNLMNFLSHLANQQIAGQKRHLKRIHQIFEIESMRPEESLNNASGHIGHALI